MSKKNEKNNTIKGRIRLTAGGSGFFTKEDGEDLRIPNNSLNTALDGDTVEIKERPKPDRFGNKVGEVVKIIKRKRFKFVGTFHKENGLFFVAPDSKRMYTDIIIPEKELAGAKENKKVYVEITKWTDHKKNPLGKILEIIGEKGEHEVEIRSIILENQIDVGFPKTVLDELEKIDFKISQQETGKRRDFRKTATFTIDPVDAKDFDDAISVEKLPNGNYEIGIHIADVSHYVRPGTELDKEARERAFSVYLVDRTIPMLPEKLSNDICSLNPEVERLCFSAVFEMTPGAEVKSHWFGKGIIKSDKRFDYAMAQNVLDGKEKSPFLEELKILETISLKMRKGRVDRGSILFEKDEVRIELDKKGRPVKIYKKERLSTHKLVEEFMLLANRKVAEFIEKRAKKEDVKKIFLYRIHDLPDKEKLDEIALFLRAFGYKADFGDTIDSRKINKILNQVKGKPEEDLINRALIRSMAKAEYSTKNIGHFGLSFKFYTHFTSPIRRYPDLLVHRLLESHLDKRPITGKELQNYNRVAMESSARESEIAKAERDSIKYKQIEYMSEKIGETFEATISGVTDWGIYVEEVNTGAEGLVKLSDIKGDYYTLDKKYTIKGRRTGKKFRMGDKVKVKLIHADLDQRTMDFVFV